MGSRELKQEFRISVQVQGVAFVDDDHLAVAPQTGGIYVYTLEPEELVDIVRCSLNRGFTPLEFQQYNFGTTPQPGSAAQRRLTPAREHSSQPRNPPLSGS